MKPDGLICYNPWDSQSARIYGTGGVYHSICANAKNSGLIRDGIVYAVSMDGKPKADNEDDSNPICFQLCGDRDNPSVSVSNKAYCIPANPMSDRGQAVVYAASMDGKSKADASADITNTLTVPDKQSKVMVTAYAVDLYNGEMGGVRDIER